MSWLTTPIPIYQLLILLTIYVLYKEFVKIALKAFIRYLKSRRQNNGQAQILEKPEDLNT